MIIPVNNNFSPLPFYIVSGNELDNKYLQSNKPYAYGAVFDMPISEGWIMPFQFTVDGFYDTLVSGVIVPVGTHNSTIDISSGIAIRHDTTANDTTTIYYKGEHKALTPIGRAYIRIVVQRREDTASITLMSDIFTNIQASQNNQKKIPNGYIRLTYSNDHTLKYGGGQVNFSNIDGGFNFELLINATICKPVYNFEEKASERLGYRYIESQISTKTYSFSFTAPEYLCDALRILPMCNYRMIKDEWHTYNKVTDVNVDVEWLEQGDLAKVTITFNNDTVMANLAEYESIVPVRLATNLPIPDPPLVTIPEVVLNMATSGGQTMVRTAATVNSDGNGTITERGVCWSTTGTPTIASSHQAHAIAAVGDYRMSINGLTAGTLYYFRAYAINEEGIAYSGVETVTTDSAGLAPTVRTYDTNNVMDVYAYLTGDVLDEGSQPVTARGFEVTETGAIVQNIQINTRSDVFTERVEGLKPETIYEFRAYAINAVGTSYGERKSFTTRKPVNKPPTVITDMNPRNVSASGATLGGTVTSSGGASITERGICLIAGDNTPTINSTKLVDAGTDLGTFYLDVDNLVAGQQYSYRAYAINYAGVSYGETGMFTTVGTAGVPLVSLDSVSASVNSIALKGSVASDEGSAVTARGFMYSLSSDMSNPTSVAATSVSGKEFSGIITGLQADTTYYIKAYAVNGAGTGYSSMQSVTTQANPVHLPAVTVEQVEEPSMAQRSILFEAEVTDGGGATVTERGICWAYSNSPTISEYHQAAATSGTGAYEVSVQVADFTANRRVYYRAYAINSAGVGYSDVKHFGSDSVPVNPPIDER